LWFVVPIIFIQQQQDWKRAVIRGVPLVHRGEVWLVSSQLKRRLLQERATYKSAIRINLAAALSTDVSAVT
jgi:hypothetical protein